MLNNIEAVFENGVFRPLEPPAVTEHERVKLTVFREIDHDWLDAEFIDACAKEADLTVSLTDVRAALAKIGGSLDPAIDADRGDY
jgi:predicted DNA-binding antitoxin AbrB/MazE fold protein